jgi:acetyltransferase-like isoleucine patch superfamily enzyme
VRIGSDVLIAQSAAFVGGDHFIPGDDQLIRKAGRPTMKSISIEPDVWIGYGAIIVDGITIGRGAVIGAGTVISKDVESYAVVTGTSYTFRRRR